MKLNLKCILFIFMCLFVINTDNVLAKTWDCPYIYDNGEKYTYRIDNEKGTMEITNKKEDVDEWYNVFSKFYYTYKIMPSNLEVQSYVDDYCPVLYLAVQNFTTQSCSDGTPQICYTTNSYTYTTYTESYIRDSNTEGCVVKRDKFCLENFTLGLGFSNTNSFFEGKLDKDDPGSKDKTTGSTCTSWSILEKDIRDEYEKYKNCDSSSCTSYISTANSIINKLKETCKTILSYRDIYVGTGDDAIEDACVKSCLNLGENVNNIKKEYGISTDSDGGACGLSEKLIIYIANIVKWVKYIIPVIVIVLGILDFIKAISADKEDEMKKAQGRFVKRLIAAALIFIIPFIIEFVLGKMGFTSNGCGIIDL